MKRKKKSDDGDGCYEIKDIMNNMMSNCEKKYILVMKLMIKMLDVFLSSFLSI